MQKPHNVSELANEMNEEIPNVSHHLSVLRHADVVSTRRDGKFIIYSLNSQYHRPTEAPGGVLDFGYCKVELRFQTVRAEPSPAPIAG